MATTTEDENRARATAMLANAVVPSGCYDKEAVMKALAMGADVNAPLPEGLWSMGGELPSPLHVAFRHGNAELASLLMSAGASIDGLDASGTPTAFWLNVGPCACAWIAAGGEPWKMVESKSPRHRNNQGERKNLAWIACRGGDAELWGMLAEAFTPDVDLAELVSTSDFYTSEGQESVMGAAIAWTNLIAIETLFKLGYRREERHIAKIAKDLACAQQRYQRFGAQRMAKLFFRFGARPPADESYQKFEWLVGPQAVNDVKAWMEEAFLEAEKKALSKAAKARGTRKPLGGRGRL